MLNGLLLMSLYKYLHMKNSSTEAAFLFCCHFLGLSILGSRVPYDAVPYDTVPYDTVILFDGSYWA